MNTDTTSAVPKVTKWIPTTNLMMLRRMGKLTEELAELTVVAQRCIIQGIDEVDPGSGDVNRLRLEQEIGDVQAQLNVTREWLKLDAAFIDARAERKAGYMREWEAMFDDGALAQTSEPAPSTPIPGEPT